MLLSLIAFIALILLLVLFLLKWLHDDQQEAKQIMNPDEKKILTQSTVMPEDQMPINQWFRYIHSNPLNS